MSASSYDKVHAALHFASSSTGAAVLGVADKAQFELLNSILVCNFKTGASVRIA